MGRSGKAAVSKRAAGRGGRRLVTSQQGRRKSAGRVAGAGVSVELVVSTFDGRRRDEKRIERVGLVRRPVGGYKGDFPRAQDRESAARQVARGLQADKLACLLAAVGHHQRIRIVLKLLGGEATHRLLAKATGLKAGPLYYHLRELRLAGLIGPKVRDLYVLTPKGQRALLAVLAMERMCR